MKPIQQVCVIDDDEIYIFLIKKALAALQLELSVNTFSNGDEAINGLQVLVDQHQSLPQIIFLDINMPIMDGWEFLESFKKIQKQIPSTIPIYIISSSIAPEDREKTKRFPEIIGYLSKPIELETLSSIIHQED